VRDGQDGDRCRLDEVRDDEEALLAPLVVNPRADDEQSRLGAQIAAVSTPSSAALACCVVTAMSGRASSEIRSPSCDTVCPDQ